VDDIPWVQFTSTSHHGGNYVLIIGKPDKMLRDLRKSKGSRQLSAVSMEILVSRVNNVSNFVFSLGQADGTFANLVLCHLWLCRNILKQTLQFLCTVAI
jgi:hypothetical protein